MSAVKNCVLDGTEDTDNIETVMFLESFIFKCDEGFLNMIRNLINAHNGSVFVSKNIVDNLTAVIIQNRAL